MDVKAIAWYFPRFSAIPEQDVSRRRGLADWRKVVTARRLYQGHYQPRVPTDFGYYDVTSPEVRKAQAMLAASYGIFGFCYQYYGISNEELRYSPIQAVLDSGEPDFPFCICWSNENWMVQWDGCGSDMLLDRAAAERDQIRFIEDMIRVFKDPRYIRVDGRPLLLVSRIDLTDNPKAVTDYWRYRAKEEGFVDLFLIICEHGCSKVHTRPERQGFDASFEFYPLFSLANRWTSVPPGVPADLNICDYAAQAVAAANRPCPDYKLFRSVMLHWDDTPSNGKLGSVFENFSPEIYEWWLTETCLQTIERHRHEERFVFINAWNGWTRGTYLEPDVLYGHRNLQATKRALLSSGCYSKFNNMQSEEGVYGALSSSEAGDYFRHQTNLIKAVSQLAFKKYSEPASLRETTRESSSIVTRHYGPALRAVQALSKLTNSIHLNIRKPKLLDRWLSPANVALKPSTDRQELDCSAHDAYDGEGTKCILAEEGPEQLDIPATMSAKPSTVLFISHDASRTGAPIMFLSLLNVIKSASVCNMKVILRRGGVLENRFRDVAETIVLTGDETTDRALLNNSLGTCDVKLIYSNTVVNGDVLALLGGYNVPVVTHIHELEMGIARFAGNGLFDMTKALSTHYIADSRAVQRHLVQHHGVQEESIRVIYGFIENHGLTEADVDAHRRAIRGRLNIKPEDFVVTGCGTLDWRKGPEVFLEVAHQVLTKADDLDVHFVWVGGGGDEFSFPQLTWELKKRGVSERVHFVGEAENVLPYFCATDVFCLTSREDPFPLVCLHALSVGKPVVCFADAGGMPELVADTCGLVVPYLDTLAMTDAILHLRKDLNDYLRFSARGVQEIQERHLAAVGGKLIGEFIEGLMRKGLASHSP